MIHCHDNVEYWVKHHSDAKPVRGRLFFTPNPTGRYSFRAHSVLDENGRLIDITPLDENTQREGLVFPGHSGTEEQFLAMKIPYSQVTYPPTAVRTTSLRRRPGRRIGAVDARMRGDGTGHRPWSSRPATGV
jgi:hypothetical protein